MVCQKVSRGKEREESFTATEYVPLGNSHMKRNTLPRGNGVGTIRNPLPNTMANKMVIDENIKNSSSTAAIRDHMFIILYYIYAYYFF